MDVATIEHYMREANPIPDLGDLDVDELIRSAAAVEAKREFVTSGTVPGPAALQRGPRERRRGVLAFGTAFAVVLASVGIGSVALRSDSPAVDDASEPAGPIQIESLAVGWERVTGDPMTEEVVRMCSSPLKGMYPACVISSLPGGAFYLTNIASEGTAWSPDGLTWFDGPPQGLRRDQVGAVPEPSALAGDLAVIAGGDERSVWIGDPRTGTWKSIALDIVGVENPVVLAVAASSDEALAVGRGFLHEDGEERNLVWLVDLRQGTAQRHVLPGRLIPEVEEIGGGPVLAGWAHGNWVVVPVRDGSEFDVLYSSDAANWQPVDLPGTGAESDENTIGSLVVGNAGVVAFGDLPDDVLEAHNGLWFSADGVDWSVVQPINATPVAVAYSDVLGFIAATDGEGEARVSADGRDWREVGMLPWSAGNNAEKVLGVSGSVLLSAGADGLWRWTPEAAAAAPGPVVEPLVESIAPVWTSPDGNTWARVPHSAAFTGGDVSVHDVVSGGPGLVAVGTADEAAAVWTSADGISWSRVPHDVAIFGGAGVQIMESITAGGPGFVAVGLRFDEPGRRGLAAAAWTSTDGLAWSPVPANDSAFRPSIDESGNSFAWMRGVTAGGPGLVAVGTVAASAAVWTSPDGIIWTRVRHDPEVFGDSDVEATDRAEMLDVATNGPGLVAVGSAGPTQSSKTAAVWTSPDGISWSRIPHDEAVFGGDGSQAIRSVSAGGPGLVAVGTAVWTSLDGLTWSRAHPDEGALFGHLNSVAIGGPGLVAVGTAVWMSEDGISWSSVPVGGGFEGMGVTVGGSGLVAVGSV